MRLLLAAMGLTVAAGIAANQTASKFSFVILGDRTGEAQPGVFEEVWKEAAAEDPAFALTVGDAIEGGDDHTAESQWSEVEHIWKSRRFPLYLTPGNHDIWSAASDSLFRKHAGREPRYSFDYRQVHVTVLDNSRTEDLPASELDFLEADLKAHAGAAIKLIVSHRPSWLLNAGFGNRDFALHRIARQYGVQLVIAGHVHQLLRIELEGITYFSMPSAGGHLRLSKAYEDGWFFGHVRAEADGGELRLHIEEAKTPAGNGRVTSPAEWGMSGLVNRPARQRAAGGSWSGGIPAR